MADSLKILVTILVSSDLPRAIRCIKSCEIQKDHNLNYETYVVINTLNKEFEGHMVDYCNWSGKNYIITESDGTPSTGKNSVFEFFNKRTDFTHLVQIDGDDFLYPTFLRHIERHIKKYPTTDVLGILPCDSIYENNEKDFFQLENGLFAGLWGTNYIDWGEFWLPFETDPIFSDKCKGNPSRLMLFSRKVSENFLYDKDQLIGEDYKIHFDLLFSHQKDEIIYWFTSASDTWVRDTTSKGIQKTETNQLIDGVKKSDFYQEKLKKYVEEKHGVFRSGCGEIPIDFAPMYMTREDKIKFLNDFL